MPVPPDVIGVTVMPVADEQSGNHSDAAPLYGATSVLTDKKETVSTRGVMPRAGRDDRAASSANQLDRD
jgi:hypothetical protein